MARVVNSIMLSTGGGTEITVVANYSALPDPTTATGEFYWASASQGTSWLPGSLGGTYYNSGMYYSNGVSWEFMNVPYQATQLEVNTGTNTDKFVTPSTLKNSTQFQFVDFTSSGQTQLNNRSKILVKNAVATTGINSSTLETILGTPVLIPANFYNTDDIMRIISARFESGGLGGTINYRIYINTTPNLSGTPLRICEIQQASGANLNAKISNRSYSITGGLIRGVFGINSTGLDSGTSSTAISTGSFNPAIDNYIVVAGICAISNLNNARQTELYISN